MNIRRFVVFAFSRAAKSLITRRAEASVKEAARRADALADKIGWAEVIE